MLTIEPRMVIIFRAHNLNTYIFLYPYWEPLTTQIEMSDEDK